MARISIRFNTQLTHVRDIAAATRINSLSKSEVVNRALSIAAADPSAMLSTLLQANTSAAASEHKPATFTTDPTILSAADLTASKLYLSRDHFLRLALDYYLYHVLETENGGI